MREGDAMNRITHVHMKYTDASHPEKPAALREPHHTPYYTKVLIILKRIPASILPALGSIMLL